MQSKTVVITGGASGIGLLAAQTFAAHGARIAILDFNPAVADIARQLPGDNHVGLHVDVVDVEEVEAAVTTIAASGPIHHLVAAAGLLSQTPLLEITTQDFRRILEVNVLGVQNVISAIARHMIATGTPGSLAIIGSLSAFTGGGMMGKGAYSASKAALLGLVRSYARELAPHGIRINTVAPSATETPMTQNLDPKAREAIISQTLRGSLLEPAEIVGAVSFLLSADASAVTGQTIHANGGSYFV